MALFSSNFTDEKGSFAVCSRYYDELHDVLTKPAFRCALDDLDRNILAHLSQDARVSVAVLARRMKVARSTVQARLERLETSGAIAGYTVRLGEEARIAGFAQPFCWSSNRAACRQFWLA